ncbi:MAG: acyltransferase domain-containing protein, partial [Bacteroidota bacterium]
ALFVIEYALARLLMTWGIQPDVLIGHSIGEYTAACISGVFSLEDALRLVLKRGEFMQRAVKGCMLSIPISEEELLPFLTPHKALSLAAVNGPQNCVVSGEEKAIKAFQLQMEAQNYVCKSIHTSHAFHSQMMDEVLEAFEQEVKQVNIRQPQIPFISNLTAKEASYEEISNPEYWTHQLRHTVRFAEGVSYIAAKQETVFVETGPGRVLSNLVRSNTEVKEKHKVINLLRHPKETGDDNYHLFHGLGRLWLAGIEPDLESIYSGEVRQRVSIPTYSFEKIPYPVHVNSTKMIQGLLSDGEEDKNTLISHWLYRPTWKLAPLFKENRNTQVENPCNLIFADRTGVIDALEEQLLGNNEEVIRIEIGNHFSKISSKVYQINPQNARDFDQLFRHLSKDAYIPNRIIHSWGISSSHTEPLPEKELARSYEENYYSLIHTLKAAQAHGGILGKKLIVLSTGLHSVLTQEKIDPVKAMLLGLMKVIPQEYPSVICKHIDISQVEKREGEFYERLYQEISHDHSNHTVSLRGSQRWEQVFDRLQIRNEYDHIHFKEKGVYLITGGLGELGYSLALHLLKKYQAQLVLLGRTPIGPKEKWESLLKDPHVDKSLEKRIRRLQELEEAGGDVYYVAGNIALEEDLAHAVNLAEKKYGPIQGVIHA